MRFRRLLAVLLAALTLTGAGAISQFALAATSTPAETCDDKKDNDGDGKIDLEDDDCTEPTVYRCADGVDNDKDGLKDFPADPGCRDANDNAEADLCQDGKDNNGDGKIDGDDPRCEPGSGLGGEQAFECNDGKNNNDGDNKIDFPADPGCTGPYDRSEKPACSDKMDNDKDGRVDFGDGDLNDPGCESANDNDESGEPARESCADNVDNDRDGLVDLDDPDCDERPDCADEQDNDGDGKTDFGEEETNDPGCSSPDDDDERFDCEDGRDNDGDGKTDFGEEETNDPGCESAEDDETDACSGDETTPEGEPMGGGLSGDGTIAQSLYDGGLNQAEGLVGDPDAEGAVSSRLYPSNTPVTDEVACLASLPLDNTL